MTDKTVKIFNQFYNLDTVVTADQYDLVYSYFKNLTPSQASAQAFTENLFRVANETQIDAIDLLQTFKGDKLTMSLTMAYYLNSLSNKTVLYGINEIATPNNNVARNIIQ
jgi:hypothetical protein